MPEPIDWEATMWDWADTADADTSYLLRLADPRGLCTEWRNLAHQEREENARLREENRRLRADLDRLKPSGMQWPFR